MRATTILIIAVGFVAGFVGVRYYLLSHSEAERFTVTPPVVKAPVPESPDDTPLETASPGIEVVPSEVAEPPDIAALEESPESAARTEVTAEEEHVTISGIVLASATGAPVAGAKIGLSTWHVEGFDLDEIDFDFAEMELPPGVTLEDLRAAMPEFPTAAGHALSGEDGSFRLEIPAHAVPRGYGDLVCTAPGFARSAKPLGEIMPSRDARSARVDFLLEQGGGIAGRVTSAASGEGLAQVRVQFSDAQREASLEFGFGMEDEIETSTDAAGYYQFDSLAPGVYRVTAQDSGGHVLPRGKRLVAQVRSGEVREAFDISLEPGAELRGTVRDAAGAPLEGAMVTPVPQPMLEGDSIDFFAFFDSGDIVNFRTRETGAYEMRGLQFDSSYVLAVQADGHAPHHSEPFRITRGRSPHVYDVTLTQGSKVSGVAKYDDGAPAARVRVMTLPDFHEMTERMHDQHEARTDEEGRFTIEHVPAGSYTLSAGWSRSPRYSLEVEVDGVRDVSGLELAVRGSPRPHAGAGEVIGRVTGATNTAIEGAEIALREYGEEPVLARTTTDAEGRFTLGGLKEDEYYSVTATAEANTATEDFVEAGETVRLRIGVDSTVSGLVLDQTWEPVARAVVKLVTASDEDGPERMFGFFDRESTRSNDSGYWEISGVEEGTYTVTARRSDRGHAESEAFDVVGGASVENILLRLTPGLHISGRATGAGGRAVGGAEITLRPQSDDPESEQMAMFMPLDLLGGQELTLSAADGSFHFENMRPGTYVLRATHAEHAPFVLRDILLERDERDLRVVFAEGGCVTGQPGAVGLMVYLMGDSGANTATTRADGSFEVCGLAPGSYTLMVMDMQEAMSAMPMPRVHSVMVESGRTTEVDFGPPPGSVAVQGRIQGVESEGLHLTLSRPGTASIHELESSFDMDLIFETLANTHHTTIGADGSFSLEGVLPGEYVLEIMDMSALMDMDFDFEAMEDGDHLAHIHEPLLTQEVQIEAGQPLELDLTLPGR